MGMNNAVQPLQIKAGESSRNIEISGPVEERECRDVVFCGLFIIFIAGMGLVSWKAATLGNPYRLIYGTDSYGNVCNQDNDAIAGVNPSLTGLDLREEPYLYYFNDGVFTSVVDTFGNNVVSTKICVSKCPSSALRTISDMQNFTNATGSSLCVYDITTAAYFDGTTHLLNGLSECPTLPIKSHEELLFRCVPTSMTNKIDHIMSAINSLLDAIEENLVEKEASDIQNCWLEMCMLCVIAIVVSVVLTLLLQFVAWFIVWCMVIAMVIGTLIASGVCWYHYYDIRTGLDATAADDRTSQMERNVRHWLIGSTCITVITVIVVLVLLAVRKHIKLVVELFRQAGKAVKRMPFLLVLPLLTVVFLAFTFVSFVWILLYIETAGTPEVDQNTGTVQYMPDKTITALKWYHLFGVIWILQVILACHKMIIAGAVARWYFKRDKHKLSLPILRSMWNIIRYHFGSIVLGCLIITIVMFARMVLSFVENRLRGKTHPIAVFLLKCFKCCLWCFEKFLKFLNNNAYIEIAIYGHGFCKAARQAFHIIVNNAFRLVAINSVGDFVLFLGKVVTVTVVTVVGIELISVRKNINFVWLPITLTGIIAYFIADCFMSVYEMTIDTIFVCFCEDSAMNDGDSKPYFMSIGLRNCMSARLKMDQSDNHQHIPETSKKTKD